MMKISIYVGFQKEEQLYGCYFQPHLNNVFEENKRKLLLFKDTYSQDKWKEIFYLIHWKKEIDDSIVTDGSLLLKLLELQDLHTYKKHLDNTFKALTKNGIKNDETGEIEAIDYTDDLNKLFNNNKAVIKMNDVTKTNLAQEQYFIVNLDDQLIENNI